MLFINARGVCPTGTRDFNTHTDILQCLRQENFAEIRCSGDLCLHQDNGLTLLCLCWDFWLKAAHGFLPYSALRVHVIPFFKTPVWSQEEDVNCNTEKLYTTLLEFQTQELRRCLQQWYSLESLHQVDRELLLEVCRSQFSCFRAKPFFFTHFRVCIFGFV
jgi:hypothetical protein